MTEIPEEAVAAVKTHVFHAITRWKMAASDDAVVQMMARSQLIEDILEFAAPLIRQDERERLAAVISPEQFRKLAEWFDVDDQFKEAMFPETWSPGTRKDDVQQDLRKFADLLDGDGNG